MRAWAYIVVGWALHAGGARADSLHVYGPPGAAGERRALAVLEDTAGGCVPATSLEVSADGVTVELGEPAGECARWIRIVADPPRPTVELAAAGGSAHATLVVELGAAVPLSITASRRAEHVDVTLPDGVVGSDPSGEVVWSDGRASLERARGGLTARCPRDRLVLVVVRAGGRVGATLVAPAVSSGVPESVLVGSDLAVSAGGAPRTAAFLAVVDARGRPSSNVPLTVRSERGRLRRLTWITAGLAAIDLSADSGPTIDLVAQARGGPPASLELPVTASWPVDAVVGTPETAAADVAVRIRPAVRLADSSELRVEDIRLRCDGVEAALEEEGTAACPAGTRTVVVGARVDGRTIPLRTAAIRVAPAVAATPVASSEDESVSRAPAAAGAVRTASSDPDAVIAVLASGGVDGWGRLVLGAGARASFPFGVRFRLLGGARFSSTPVQATGRGLVRGMLDGTERAVVLEIGGEVALGAFVARVDAGPAWISVTATAAGDPAGSDAVGAVASAALGPRLWFGAIEFHLAAVARAGIYTATGWESSAVVLGFEASGGIPIGG